MKIKKKEKDSLAAPASPPLRSPRPPRDKLRPPLSASFPHHAETLTPTKMPAREIAIANRHPRLRLDRRAVAHIIHTLDACFFATPRGSRKNHRRSPKSASPLPSVPAGELSLVFLTDAALAQLHADFLDDPTTTDVITFEGSPALGTAGEICVSADAALRHLAAPTPSRKSRARHGNALAPALSAQLSALNSAAFSTELTLYLVHGWLHLAGYDDLVPAKKRLMRRAESRALKILRAHECLPSFRLI